MARKLTKNVYVGETLYRAGSTPPKDIAEQITNPKAWDGDAPDAVDDAVDEAPDYDSMAPDSLAALADTRGVEVKGTGKDGNVLKKDLVAALKSADQS